jgi:hypothetical protein
MIMQASSLAFWLTFFRLFLGEIFIVFRLALFTFGGCEILFLN